MKVDNVFLKYLILIFYFYKLLQINYRLLKRKSAGKTKRTNTFVKL